LCIDFSRRCRVNNVISFHFISEVL
jgi:hypothetical protein